MLGASGIKKELERGNLIIDPFNQDQLGPNSYDLRIGNWIYRYNTSFQTEYRILDKEDASSLFYAKPERCDRYIFINSGERILAHTEEFAGSVRKYVPQIACRSTIARIGLDVCASAGFGDVGFINRWTLEMYNFSPLPIAIPVGVRVCQIFFNRIDIVEGQDPEPVLYNGSYNPTNTNWQPEEMLPKLPMVT